jgi:hypothetical protein
VNAMGPGASPLVVGLEELEQPQNSKNEISESRMIQVYRVC